MHYTFAMGAAYQIYDLVIMAFQQVDPLPMWIHHGISLLGFITLIETHQTAFYPVAFLFSEVTVFFVNGLWYARSFNAPSAVLEFLRIARAVSYVIFRSWIGPWVFYRAYLAGDVGRLHLLPAFPRYLVCANVIVMTLLNFNWTFESITSLFRSRDKTKKPKTQ
jgi:hypothetical protein